MVDFTSALYLGLRHPTWALRPWTQVSLGKPAAIQSPPGAAHVGRQLAELQGCEASTLGPSTFHLFWDLFDLLAKESILVFMDAQTYPIARWGAERARTRGVRVRQFPHHSARALCQQVRQHCRPGLHPVVLTDGVCPRCGKVAPLEKYLALVREQGGWLVIDDTQALGLLGEQPGSDMPYGWGGGGSPRHAGAGGSQVVQISSLAKALGVPLAVLGGASDLVAAFEKHSKTRVHCSPPSVPDVRAAERALAVNLRHGNLLRRRLLKLVNQFRDGLAAAGLASEGGSFPVQTVTLPGQDTEQIHRHLSQHGIRAVLQRPRAECRPQLSFLITASHKPKEIDQAIGALAKVSRSVRFRIKENYVCAA